MPFWNSSDFAPDETGSTNPVVETFHGFVETTQDALILFDACRRGILNMVTQRLSQEERETIGSGSCFIYCEETSKIKRWTDGRLWSPSRILGSFLIYRELEYKVPQPRLEKYDKTNRKTIDLNGKTAVVGSKGTFIVRDGGLVKKTISANIDGYDYHLVTYYLPDDLEFGRLETPRRIPELAMLEPYEGIRLSQQFSSSKKRAGDSSEPSESPLAGSPILLPGTSSSRNQKRNRSSETSPTTAKKSKSAKDPCPLSIKEWRAGNTRKSQSSSATHKRTQSESAGTHLRTRSSTISNSFLDSLQFPYFLCHQPESFSPYHQHHVSLPTINSIVPNYQAPLKMNSGSLLQDPFLNSNPVPPSSLARSRTKSDSKLYRRHSFPLGFHTGLLTTFPDSYFHQVTSP